MSWPGSNPQFFMKTKKVLRSRVLTLGSHNSINVSIKYKKAVLKIKSDDSYVFFDMSIAG